ncbi:hypothetical protein JXQ31_20065 [candidate division KSB1 bacterium]|nr:hypothetical protein [candidate division KSB1 bacterium]
MTLNNKRSKIKLKDDLKKINGIGCLLEKKLNKFGIYSYIQLASISETELEWLQDNIGAFPKRIVRDKWVEQALELYIQKYGETIML